MAIIKSISSQRRSGRIISVVCLILVICFCSSSCSIKKMAMNSVADALSDDESSVFNQHDDPQFVGEALPFALLTMESVLQSTPEHRELLVATAAGYVKYGHAFVLRPSEILEHTDLQEARKERLRAKNVFLRARGYGLRALELDYPGITEQLHYDAQSALENTTKEDVPALYWTGIAWVSAISAAKNDMALVGDLAVVESLMDLALFLDENWGEGAIQEFYIIYDAGRSEGQGGGIVKAKEHFKKAMALNQGQLISPLVTFAESVCIQEQNLTQFSDLLADALTFDVDQYPQHRLANILAQKKAQYLLDNRDLFFIVGDEILIRQK